MNSQILRDRSHWAAGWLQLSEMQEVENAQAAATGGDRCQGTRGVMQEGERAHRQQLQVGRGHGMRGVGMMLQGGCS